MSGFEITGVILGAIPVIIGALEQYKKARETWHRFNQKGLYIDRLIQALEEQSVLIETDLHLLLRAVGFQRDDIIAKGGNNCHDCLRDSEIATEIEQYLGQSYRPYCKALSRCEVALEEIARKIGGLVPRSQGKEIDPGSLADLIKANVSPDGKLDLRRRIKFSLQKDELDRRISELDNSTKMLGRLRLSGALMHEENVQSSSRTITKLAAFLHKIQEHAASLHSAISSSWAVGCHPEHRINLYLDNRSAPLTREKPQVTFKLDVGFIKQSTDSSIFWHKAQIDLLKIQGPEDLSDRAMQSAPSQRARVTINLPMPSDPVTDQVHNICSCITRAAEDDRPLKLYLSDQGTLRSCHVALSGATVPGYANPAASFVTLEQILCEASDLRNLSKRRNLHQRMVLAYRVASSLLQYHSTPWLAQSWSKKEIRFLRSESLRPTPNTATVFEPDHPFVSHVFSDASRGSSTRSPSPKQSLLSLGILLLEIWHVMTFEAYAAVEGLTVDATYGSQYNAAMKWLNDTADNILGYYLDAVCRCIEGTFASSSPMLDWKDLQFRKSVCEGVMKPLWENCSSAVRQGR